MTKQVKEGLGDLAAMAERDHEVQMARADLYKLAKYAIKLHDMLKSVSEAEGIEGWKQAKITTAADDISSVYHAMDYDVKFAQLLFNAVYLTSNITLNRSFFMSDRTYGAEEKAKLERLVQEGVTVLQEIEDLNMGLKDTVKAVAEELDIKSSLINKAIKIAQKRDWDKHYDAFDDLETLVTTVGIDK